MRPGTSEESAMLGVTLVAGCLGPLTGYFYVDSDVALVCAERLDVFLTLIWWMLIVLFCQLLGTMSGYKVFEEQSTRLPYLLTGWCALSVLQSAHNLQAVTSCWLQFRYLQPYETKHLAVFIVYGLVALVYGLIMGRIFLILVSGERNAAEEQKTRLLKSLKEWQEEHQLNPTSETSLNKLRSVLVNTSTFSSSRFPDIARLCILRYFFYDVVFQGYRKDKNKSQETIHCDICSSKLQIGERYSDAPELKMVGPVHFDCFFKSESGRASVEKLRFASCLTAYERYRERKNTIRI